MISIKLQNLGTINKNKVMILTDHGDLTLFFSYKTIVGFNLDINGGGYSSFVSQNEWGKTTGKLLNELEQDKKRRVPYSELMQKLNENINKLFLTEKERVIVGLSENETRTN